MSDSAAERTPEPEETVIVALRVGEAATIVRGSRQAKCVRCGAAVWLSPSSLPLAAEGLPVWCIPCLLPTLPEEQKIEVALAPGALREIAESIAGGRAEPTGAEPTGDGSAEKLLARLTLPKPRPAQRRSPAPPARRPRRKRPPAG